MTKESVVLLLAVIVGILQISLSSAVVENLGSVPPTGSVPVPAAGSAASFDPQPSEVNIPILNPPSVVPADTTNPTATQQLPVNKNDNLFKQNQEAFANLQGMGNIGLILYDLLTSEQGLGDEMTLVTTSILGMISFDNYRSSLNRIFQILQTDAALDPLKNVYERVKTITDPSTNASLGDAVEIFVRALNDPYTVSQIRSAIVGYPVNPIQMSQEPMVMRS